jgi:hypothetical protein
MLVQSFQLWSNETFQWEMLWCSNSYGLEWFASWAFSRSNSHRYFVVTMWKLFTFKLFNVAIYWNVLITSQLGPPHKPAFAPWIWCHVSIWWKQLVHCWSLFKDMMSLFMISLQLWRSAKANFISYILTAFISDEFWSLNGLMVCNH